MKSVESLYRHKSHIQEAVMVAVGVAPETAQQSPPKSKAAADFSCVDIQLCIYTCSTVVKGKVA